MMKLYIETPDTKEEKRLVKWSNPIVLSTSRLMYVCGFTDVKVQSSY